MMQVQWCVDEHHGAPCPFPCAACEEECSGRSVPETEAKALWPELPTNWFEEMKA